MVEYDEFFIKIPNNMVRNKYDERGKIIMNSIIKDNGKGIDKDVREKIFDVFVREDKARNSSTGGTGLGLAITKAIIEKHSGDIYLVDSDKGTEYCITFNMR